MNRVEYTFKEESMEFGTGHEIEVGKTDLITLRYMLRKVIVTLEASKIVDESPLPWHYAFEERQKRAHRLVVCAPWELEQATRLCFVGFVSGRAQGVESAIAEELIRIDQQMLTELVHIPGLLSYSSLELCAGNWYNLVILREGSIKEHLKALGAHQYAAYKLAPAYYEWIRLHRGVMPGGLMNQQMRLQSTKFYSFTGLRQPPCVQELVYQD